MLSGKNIGCQRRGYEEHILDALRHYMVDMTLVLIEVENVKAVEEFGIDRSRYGNMDDWLPVEDIDSVKR